MRAAVMIIILYLIGGAFTYGKVFEELTPPMAPENARTAALDAALKWPAFWVMQARN